jgi:hypothetical protein
VPFSLQVFTSIVYKDLNLYSIISIILLKIRQGRHSFTIEFLSRFLQGFPLFIIVKSETFFQV